MYKLWSERGLPEDFVALLEGIAQELPAASSTPNDSLSNISDADGIIAGGFTYDAALMDKAPKLKVIARTGIGVDSVDIPEATARGIAVVNVPDGPTKSTAEHTIMLMLAVAKNLKQSEARLRAGEKDLYQRNVAIELDGKTLGLAGFGRIARRVARAGRGLGMNVLSYDPYVHSDVAKEAGVIMLDSFDELLGSSDVLSIHTPLLKETKKMMNRETFGRMKKGSIFINAARGGLVDEAALLEALESEQLFGAGLDVTDPEPPLLDNPLLTKHNVIVTPHVASGTTEGRAANFEGAIRQALDVLQGERPINLVNPEVWQA